MIRVPSKNDDGNREKTLLQKIKETANQYYRTKRTSWQQFSWNKHEMVSFESDELLRFLYCENTIFWKYNLQL